MVTKTKTKTPAAKKTAKAPPASERRLIANYDSEVWDLRMAVCEKLYGNILDMLAANDLEDNTVAFHNLRIIHEAIGALLEHLDLGASINFNDEDESRESVIELLGACPMTEYEVRLYARIERFKNKLYLENRHRLTDEPL